MGATINSFASVYYEGGTTGENFYSLKSFVNNQIMGTIDPGTGTFTATFWVNLRNNYFGLNNPARIRIRVAGKINPSTGEARVTYAGSGWTPCTTIPQG